MSTLTMRLWRGLRQDRGLPFGARLKDRTVAAAGFLTHAWVAPAALGDCDKVGAWVRTPGGVPVVENRGCIEIGRHSVLNSMFSPVHLSAEPGAAIRIGESCYINFGSVIRARQRVSIGNSVSFGPYCTVADAGPDLPAEGLPIEIGDHVWLAGRVTVLPGAKIGDGAVITAGSVVAGEIPPGVLAGGAPARVVRRLHDEPVDGCTPPVPREDVAALQALATPPAGSAAGGLEPTAAPMLPVAPFATHKALVIADFTAQDFADRLAEGTETLRFEVDVAPYQQVVPSLIGLSDSFHDLVVVWTLAENSVPSFRRLLAGEPVAEEALLDEVDAFAALLANSLRNVKCLVVPTWTLPAYHRGHGAIDLRPGGVGRALLEMNRRLIDRLDAHNHIYVLNAQRWTEQAGKHAQHPKLWYAGKVAYHGDVFEEAARDVRSTFGAVSGHARKLLVLDLDDTLWGGIVGDAGWEGLRLGGHDSVGEAFTDFQRVIKSLQRRGVLLAIASKNEESVALEAIRSHREMVLREEDFVTHRINWTDKARNVAEIADELNLGLQSVVFIDDNPVERARVREALPEVFVPEWPEDKHLYASTLLSLGCFDSTGISAEDQQRTQMMHAERQRKKTPPGDVGSIDDWLSSLEMRLHVARVSQDTMARTVQLLNKTNQLNLSTRRLTEPELSTWLDDPRHELWVLHVSDKFGDSGLTGIASLEVRGSLGRIADYVLSCRVMGRKVEEALVHVIVAAARRRGLARVEAQFLPTAKNKPCLDFWLRSGFLAEEGQLFSWDAGKDYPLPEQLRLVIEEDEGR